MKLPKIFFGESIFLKKINKKARTAFLEIQSQVFLEI